jgi:hypothetical protein
MSRIDIQVISEKRRHVMIDGQYQGWLEKVRRTRQGLNGTEAWYQWDGRVLGQDVAGTMSACKRAIAKLVTNLPEPAQPAAPEAGGPEDSADRSFKM